MLLSSLIEFFFKMIILMQFLIYRSIKTVSECPPFVLCLANGRLLHLLLWVHAPIHTWAFPRKSVNADLKHGHGWSRHTLEIYSWSQHSLRALFFLMQPLIHYCCFIYFSLQLKCCEEGSLWTELSFSWFWRLGRLLSRQGQTQDLMLACPLASLWVLAGSYGGKFL